MESTTEDSLLTENSLSTEIPLSTAEDFFMTVDFLSPETFLSAVAEDIVFIMDEYFALNYLKTLEEDRA